MRKEDCIWVLFAGILILFVTGHSVASATVKVVVVPLPKTTTCIAPDEVQSAGHCWKDRNLGASQVAITMDDAAAYGDLYQWGRPRDGHQNRFSAATTLIKSVYDDPTHGVFIITPSEPYDWRFTPNDNLWQGLGGINNPCPQGFRLPTVSELDDEKQSWSTSNAEGAFNSPLKLVVAGVHRHFDGAVVDEGSSGWYWSSTTIPNSISIFNLYFLTTGTTGISGNMRAYGFSVRCIKD